MNESESPEPIWQALPANQRRVLGVLVEKAKTTPSAYPLTLNGLTTGCNQKSNRYPVLSLDADDVEDALDALRDLKAIAEVHGDGRTVKYRHYMKDWLGVDGTELAVMTELLLRGEQTVGELRGRAARMCKGQLPDMSALKPVLQSLIAKNLLIELTPAGRGQMVTHNLYSENELDRVKRDASNSGSSGGGGATASAAPAAKAAAPTQSTTSSAPVSSDVQQQIDQLKNEVKALRSEIEDIWSSIR